MKMHAGMLKIVFLLAMVLSLASGCASGSRLLDEPVPLETTNSLAVSTDESLEITLDWVIVRDGPGTWAKNVDWDEYMLTVRNLSEDTVTVSNIQLTDSLGRSVSLERDRKSLVNKSRETVRRYASSDLTVQAGASAETLIASGGVAVVAGSAVAAYSVASALTGALAGGSGALGAAGVAATGAIVAGPALAVSGMIKASRNKAVDKEIQRRRTALPLELEPGEAKSIVLFFPLAPSPQLLSLSYTHGDEWLIHQLDTSSALKGIHLIE